MRRQNTFFVGIGCKGLAKKDHAYGKEVYNDNRMVFG